MRMSSARTREPEPQVPMEWELGELLAVLLHHYGHRVAEIRALADAVRGYRTRSTEHRALAKRLAEAADELSAGFRTMRLILCTEASANCDFVHEVVQPAVWVYQRRSGSGLVVAPAAEDLPRVRVQPRAAFLAFTHLLNLSRPSRIVCDARLREDVVELRLALDGTNRPDRERLRGVVELFREAGVAGEVVPGDPRHAVVARLRLELAESGDSLY